METSGHIAELASVSFPDFETKTSQESTKSTNIISREVASASTCCFSNYEDFGQPKLDLLSQKTDSLFVADQTPTPTRLIKNCDEVGLFDDLQHVNPFDIGFQRAAEQNAVGGQTIPTTPTHTEAPVNDGDSLHTPQVYPLESASAVDTHSHGKVDSPLDVPSVEELLATTEPKSTDSTVTTNSTSNVVAPAPLPAPIQLFQPQVITWLLPAQAVTVESTNVSKQLASGSIPVQTVRPFILPKPKLTATDKMEGLANKVPPSISVPSTPLPHTSSASLTPTSQLPIKERLKAILNSNSNRQRAFVAPPKTFRTKQSAGSEDCMERRRAAASRYRDKIRNEQKKLIEHNAQLNQENRKLRQRIAELEHELLLRHNSNNNVPAVPNEIQIPPSSIHLVINVPKMFVPSVAAVQQTTTTG